jgi:hypothetical protein
MNCGRFSLQGWGAAYSGMLRPTGRGEADIPFQKGGHIGVSGLFHCFFVSHHHSPLTFHAPASPAFRRGALIFFVFGRPTHNLCYGFIKAARRSPPHLKKSHFFHHSL